MKIDKLSDLIKVDAQLRITCLGCDHSALYHRQGVIEYFRHMHWNEYFEVAGLRFKCSKCGHRGARLKAEKLAVPPAPPKPRPLTRREIEDEVRRRRG